MKEILGKTENEKVFINEETSGYKNIGLEVETDIGILSAYPSTTDPEYPCIWLTFKPKDSEEEIDLACVEIPNGANEISIYNYEDPYTEEFTSKCIIPYKIIKDALNEN